MRTPKVCLNNYTPRKTKWLTAIDRNGDEYGKPVDGLYAVFEDSDGYIEFPVVKSKYRVGDVLWVQETWKFVQDEGLNSYSVQFKDGTKTNCVFDTLERMDKWSKYINKNGWQSPYYMPHEAARISLKVTDVRVERLQSISPEDCVAEGAVKKPHYMRYGGEKCLAIHARYKKDFTALWRGLNDKRDGCAWNDNPFVWVYRFERLKRGLKYADQSAAQLGAGSALMPAT